MYPDKDGKGCKICICSNCESCRECFDGCKICEQEDLATPKCDCGAPEICIRMLRNGLVLPAGKIAEQYMGYDGTPLTRQAVTKACREGRLIRDEAVLTDNGWFVTQAGADRIWKRIKEGNDEKLS